MDTGAGMSGVEGSAAHDADALDDMLYLDESRTAARPWCHTPTRRLAKAAARAVVEALGRDRLVTVVDYGSGSGLAAKYLHQSLVEAGMTRAEIECQVDMVVVDIPSPWFVASRRLAALWKNVRAESLVDASGKIRVLDEVMGIGSVAVVMANMVLHLIPPRALPRALHGVHGALASQGQFFWSSPDSAPVLEGGVLFHDVNRGIRCLFEQGKRGERIDLGSLSPAERALVCRIIGSAPEPTEDSRLTASRQIPSEPTSRLALDADLSECFYGEVQYCEAPIFPADFLRVASVPSNLRNLIEVPDQEDRRQLSQLLGRCAIQALECRLGPGDSGWQLTWNLGAHQARAD